MLLYLYNLSLPLPLCLTNPTHLLDLNLNVTSSWKPSHSSPETGPKHLTNAVKEFVTWHVSCLFVGLPPRLKCYDYVDIKYGST